MPIAPTVELGLNVTIYHPDLVNLYGCTIGDDTRIGAFVEIQKNVVVGSACKVSSHSFLCEGVVIEDGVFIGHSVMFTNDLVPRAVNEDGTPQAESDWSVVGTRICAGASIGSGSVILPGVTIGQSAMIGAGSVVTRDIPDYAVAFGNPACVQRMLER